MVIIPSNNPANIPPASGTFGAFRPPEAKKKKTRLYLLLTLLIILLAAGVYYFFVFGGASIGSLQAIPPAQQLNAVEIRVSRLPGLNFGIADLPIYKALKLYGDLPIKVEALGRPNPFAPF